MLVLTQVVSGKILSDITDHFPIVLFIDLIKKIDDSRPKTKVKVLNGKTLQKLCQNLQAKT